MQSDQKNAISQPTKVTECLSALPDLLQAELAVQDRKLLLISHERCRLLIPYQNYAEY